MTTKEYLMQIKRLDILIEQKLREKEKLAYSGISGIDYSKPCVQSSPQSSAAFARRADDIIVLEENINVIIDEYTALKSKITDQIQALQNPVYMQILFKKYVEFKQLGIIAAEMNFSYDYIRHTHGKALQEFGNRFLKDSTQ